ncbi:MAG: hypothetical protein IIY84_02345 [Eubacterium sp.]|nr:hypothetical protein [Eubacterium sp.]
MDKKEFVGAVGEELIRRLPEELKGGMTWAYEEVVKVNDTTLAGLILRREGNLPSPTYYLDEDYEAYLKGRTMEKIAADLAKNCAMALKDAPAIEDLGDAAKLLPGKWSRYGVRLLEAARNRRFLADAPHEEVGAGLVLAYDFKAVRAGREWRTIIQREMLEQSGLTEQELSRIAKESAWKEDRPYLAHVHPATGGLCAQNLLKREEPIRMAEGQMLVLSTRTGTYGAAALFAPGTTAKIGALLRDRFFAVPSSLHEFLILPERLAPPAEVLTEMLRDVNRNCVQPTDVLSDDVYLFGRDGSFLGKALTAHTC